MTLMGFARFYESIYGMLPSDRPTDEIIEDDEALDAWYQSYLREQAIKAGRKTDRSMEQMKENILMFAPED